MPESTRRILPIERNTREAIVSGLCPINLIKLKYQCFGKCLKNDVLLTAPGKRHKISRFGYSEDNESANCPVKLFVAAYKVANGDEKNAT